MDPLIPLPSQPAGRAWPTRAWPRERPDPRVERGALDGALDEAFAQPESLGRTNALLVVHRGAIVAERYADGVDDTTSHISWSMAKSFLHAVVGILVREGRLDVDAPADVPEWQGEGDPRRAITLDQLLRMSSGLAFVEEYVEDRGSDVIEMLFRSGKDDVAAFAAASALAHEPGSVWSYSSGTSNIIARIVGRRVSEATPGGEPSELALRRFIDRELFHPLGIESATLRHDSVGTWIGSSYVFATARDFARFGLLYLRDGVWDGRRILPEGWVDYARRETAHGEGEVNAYGAHFWVVPGDLGIFQAQGYNGQRIVLVPALDLIVVRLGVTPVENAPHLDAFTRDIVDAFRGARSG